MILRKAITFILICLMALVFAYLFASVARADQAQDYYQAYLRSRGVVVYDPQPQQGATIIINNYQNSQPYQYWPIDWAIYGNLYHDTWRFGSPAQIRKYLYRNPSWQTRPRHHKR